MKFEILGSDEGMGLFIGTEFEINNDFINLIRNQKGVDSIVEYTKYGMQVLTVKQSLIPFKLIKDNLTKVIKQFISNDLNKNENFEIGYVDDRTIFLSCLFGISDELRIKISEIVGVEDFDSGKYGIEIKTIKQSLKSFHKFEIEIREIIKNLNFEKNEIFNFIDEDINKIYLRLSFPLNDELVDLISFAKGVNGIEATKYEMVIHTANHLSIPYKDIKESISNIINAYLVEYPINQNQYKENVKDYATKNELWRFLSNYK